MALTEDISLTATSLEADSDTDDDSNPGNSAVPGSPGSANSVPGALGISRAAGNTPVGLEAGSQTLS